MKLRLTLLTALAFAIIAVPVHAGSGQAKVVRALLEKGDRGDSFGWSLSANIKNADKVVFKTRYGGERARGRGRYDDHVTTGGLHGTAKHPWKLVRNDNGRKVIRLIRAAFKATGEATVKIKVADEAGRVTTTKVTFVKSECHKDPPIYPLTCTVNNP